MWHAVSKSQEIPRLGSMSGAISLKLWRVISSTSLQTHGSPPAVADYTQRTALNRHAHAGTHTHTRSKSLVKWSHVTSSWKENTTSENFYVRDYFTTPFSLSGRKCWDMLSKYIKQTVWNKKRGSVNGRQPWKPFAETPYTLPLFFFLLSSLFLIKNHVPKTQYLRSKEWLPFYQTKTEQNLLV